MNEQLIDDLNKILKQQQAQLERSLKVFNAIEKGSNNEKMAQISEKMSAVINNPMITQEQAQKIMNELINMK